MANLHLENFAKIKNSDLDIQDITVIAGKPGTGKSYIMKMLYAINESLHLSFNINETYENLYKIEKLLNTIKISENKNKSIDNKTLSKARNLLFKTKGFLDNMNFQCSIFEENLKNLINSIFSNVEQISSYFLVDYCKNISIDYEKSELNVKVKNESSIDFNINAIFVETPLILEFKKFMNREKGKTPYHIESLLNILDTDYSFTDIEQDKFIEKFSKISHEIIQGKIESQGDSFIFNKTDDKNYDIVNASSGTKSVGLLQYLVTNKALKKGSILFWEEPEVHLHPTWQLKMIELFIELMKNGVKIVFSTHSPYMCDYLNALSKKQKIEDRVSFNLLNEEGGIISNTILNEENWNLLQSELLEPLEEIMWEYV